MSLTEFPAFPGDYEAIEEMKNGQDYFIKVYEWSSLNPVLGRTTHENPDINLENCHKDNVEVLRRKGGGGAVVLLPGVWVITAAYKKKGHIPDLPKAIEGIAETIKIALEKQVDYGISIRGMGDLCIGEKKILGSSLYQSKEIILYQGSLLVDADLQVVSKYLNHPSKEPEYRKGRSHEEFVTKLTDHGPIDIERMVNDLYLELQKFDLMELD